MIMLFYAYFVHILYATACFNAYKNKTKLFYCGYPSGKLQITFKIAQKIFFEKNIIFCKCYFNRI